ncbi:alkene reductase [Azospirillum canadense]|uniref:alkene reductase n=1 Tax=Azospirillum canadense TaxID=403962 RepID=UPI002226873F|nr:alkene reductase [Azospirillum canadense]MCW2241829.1 N-ethylmaleimide reductase [Azospirillum canadense]
MSQPLLQHYRLGSLDLANRVVMAPMTRNRGDNPENAATDLVAQYYAQRASAGLIISEGTYVSPQGAGYIHVPAIHSAAQVAGWAKVTAAVHARGGKIFAQLWHVGAVSHPDILGGELPVAPSAINPKAMAYTPNGFQATVTPRALSLSEIAGIVGDFRRAAANALAAGFDGVELHAANGYLFHQFFARSMNTRMDAYGGSVENRARFLFDVIDAVTRELPSDRIGVRINPAVHGLSGILFDEETLPLFDHVVGRLNALNLAYLHVMEPINATDQLPPELVTPSVASYFRSRYTGTLIGAVDYTQDSANAAIASGAVDLVAFGRAFIANPDLVERFAHGHPLAIPDRATFYTGGVSGYTDYPTFADGPAPRDTDTPDGFESYAETRRRFNAVVNR